MRLKPIILAFSAALLLIVGNAFGTEVVTEVAKLLASDGYMGDNFGESVSISGNVAIVGASKEGDLYPWSMPGSAYIFRWNGNSWVEEQKLLASDGDNYDEFGLSVSISGNVAIVGAHRNDDNGPSSGSAYIFRWNGSRWVEEQKLLASDGTESDFFGCSVSISGDLALVGAQGDDDKGSHSGSAYIFRWNGSRWVEKKKLLASDGYWDDNFGASVSISGNVALVGAYWDNERGSAYAYRWNGNNWVEEQKLLASDGSYRDYFGDSVAISEDLALVGARGDNSNDWIYPFDWGSAYVFRWNGRSWVEEQKLVASDGRQNANFGCSVAISQGLALVGAKGHRGISHSGLAYVYRWNGRSWVEEQKLLASDSDQYDHFGESVSISGNVALVGAYNDSANGYGSGSVYVFLTSTYQEPLPYPKAMPWIPLLLLDD